MSDLIQTGTTRRIIVRICLHLLLQPIMTPYSIGKFCMPVRSNNSPRPSNYPKSLLIFNPSSLKFLWIIPWTLNGAICSMKNANQTITTNSLTILIVATPIIKMLVKKHLIPDFSTTVLTNLMLVMILVMMLITIVLQSLSNNISLELRIR